MNVYEFLILSHLMKNSAHGYLIAHIINDIIGPYARLSNGRLYPLLAKLEQAGLIAVRTEPASAPPGDRQLRVYESPSWWPENDPANNKEHIERVLLVMQHYLDEWQLEYEWAKGLREKEMT